MKRARPCRWIGIFLVISSCSQGGLAVESAVRQPGEDWQTALSRAMEKNTDDHGLFSRSGSALGSAQAYSENLDIEALPEWRESGSELQLAFERARDERVYSQGNRPEFLRRSSWLYPDDGCYVRAAHAVYSFGRQNKLLPGKIFVFGRLRIQSGFSASGKVWWSYHVAAAFRIQNRALVIDPSIDPHRPLFLKEWLSHMSKDLNKVRIAVCDTNAYSPSRNCFGSAPISEERLSQHQRSFLDNEWSRVKSVQLNPERLLGDEPPWARLIFEPHGLANEEL